MPSTRTQRVQRRKTIRNKSIRTFSRSRVSKARAALRDDPSSETSRLAVEQAQKALDMAISKGIIHKNNAARRKSRLMRRLILKTDNET